MWDKQPRCWPSTTSTGVRWTGPASARQAGRWIPEDFASFHLRRLDTAFSQTKENNIVASRRQKIFYEPYKIGDLWLNDPTESHRKLAPHWKRPYLVQPWTGDEVGLTYQVSSPFGEEPPLQTVHYDRLRRCNLPVEDVATPGSPACVSLFDEDMDWGTGLGAGGYHDQTVAQGSLRLEGYYDPLLALWTM